MEDPLADDRRAVADLVGRLDLGCWTEAAPRLRIRAVAADRATALARPLGTALALDLTLTVGPGAAIPRTAWIERWDRPAGEIWSAARANMTADPELPPAAVPVAGRAMAVLDGPLHTSGLLADPARLLWPRLRAGGLDSAPAWAAVPAATTLLVAADGPRRLATLAVRWAADQPHSLPPDLIRIDRSGAIQPVRRPEH